jgi:hypothetical protein
MLLPPLPQLVSNFLSPFLKQLCTGRSRLPVQLSVDGTGLLAFVREAPDDEGGDETDDRADDEADPERTPGER